MLGSGHVDAVLGAHGGEAARVSLADGPELPVLVMTVDLAKDHRGLGRVIFGKVVAGDLFVRLIVDDADEGVLDLPEILLPAFGVVDGDGDRHGLNVRREEVEVNLDRFVVAVATAGLIVAGVLDRAVDRLQVVVEDECLLVRDLVVRPEHKRRGVQVEVGTVGGTGIPAEADQYPLETGLALGQADVSALAQRNGHVLHLPPVSGQHDRWVVGQLKHRPVIGHLPVAPNAALHVGEPIPSPAVPSPTQCQVEVEDSHPEALGHVLRLPLGLGRLGCLVLLRPGERRDDAGGQRAEDDQ
ncbi:hypothetical protein PHAMO_400077 [Magnetospirillum molischianum DSM 120]|uniref:Uncharacterized protein n=1 Tax=Magnetospirillum molischianum DSM 120 TaxID=1150626 RepID=H8FWF8_MAGML|nr:hypothetical protein PHAMO_400077 [Magnetospirillum molischianum DSM 120]